MTLTQAKNQIARSKGYPTWEIMENWYIDHSYIQDAVSLTRSAMSEAMKLYATEKVKEALKSVSDLMELDEWERLAILSLETELIELINKEK